MEVGVVMIEIMVVMNNEMNSVATEIEVLVVNGDGFRSSFLSGG